MTLNCEETVDSDSNIVVKYVYTLGASGERIKVEELDRTVEYTYDELYRLTSETITEGKKVTTYTYAYDSVSNRTLKTVNSDETVYTYNALNQLISENDTTYEYDNAGNLVRVIGTGKTALYEYNSENKLVKATVQQGNTVVVETYTYDYEGNRTSKTTTTSDGSVEFVKYLNDNSSLTNVLVEISNNGEVIYTVGADLISQEVDGEVYTYIYDGHGTVRALANEKGEITDTYSYDAFGNLLKSTGSTANSYLYCGEQYDSTTGLYYLRARYMDTSTGRFISMDTYQGSTADPISLHKYLYANSNPVTYTDPSGYTSITMNDVMGGIAINSILDGIIVASCLDLGLKLISDLKTATTVKMAEFEVSVNQILMLIHTGFIGTVATICKEQVVMMYETSFSVIKDYVTQRIKSKGDKYPGQYELHHIVARLHWRAASSRAILNLLDIGIDEECNTVLLKKAVHKFLHTKIYFSFINISICSAYSSSVKNGRDEKTDVLITLSYLKVSLLGLNLLC